jgi:AcrR family transcriptional regulator
MTSTMGRAKPVGRGAPGRTRTPRAEREEQMIEAASGLFAKHGFGGVSMDDIAKASGITKPMLYAYFDSKDGLFAACAEAAGEELRQELRAVSEREDLTPDKQLWEGLQRVFQFVEENHDGWLLLYPEGGVASGSIGSGAVAARDAMADLLTELFTRQGRAQGLSDEALSHTEAIAHSFTAATIGAASHWAQHGDEPRDLAALRLMNLLWMGCGSLLEGRLWLPGPPTSA